MGLLVFTLAGDRICAITRFDNSVLPRFGLPRTLGAVEEGVSSAVESPVNCPEVSWCPEAGAGTMPGS